MLKFPDDVELQENACAALCNLLSNKQDTKVLGERGRAPNGGRHSTIFA